MALAGMRARNERVEPLDLVNKAMLGEKIKRAVGHRRLRTETFGPQDIENFVSAARARCASSRISRTRRRTGVNCTPKRVQ